MTHCSITCSLSDRFQPFAWGKPAPLVEDFTLAIAVYDVGADVQAGKLVRELLEKRCAGAVVAAVGKA